MVQLAIIDFNPELMSIVKNGGQCGLDGAIPGGGPGFRRRLQHHGMTEEYSPFATPDEMLQPCSCFAPNGTYTCPTSADNGHHMAPGAGCSFDILAGGMWLQRQKQYLLANGVAVMTVNARTFDGWNIDNETYDGHRPPDPNSNPFESVTEGTDKPFFAALARDMASGKLGQLNPRAGCFPRLVWRGTDGERVGRRLCSWRAHRDHNEGRCDDVRRDPAVLQHALGHPWTRGRFPGRDRAVRQLRRWLRVQHTGLLRVSAETTTCLLPAGFAKGLWRLTGQPLCVQRLPQKQLERSSVHWLHAHDCGRFLRRERPTQPDRLLQLLLPSGVNRELLHGAPRRI